MKCAIIDDEPLARKIIKEYVAQFDDIDFIGEFKSVMNFRSSDIKDELNLIFIDINMPLISGLDFVKNFETNALIVFTTAYPEFAVDAFELQAFDYLVKPISFDRFLKCIEKAKAEITKSQINAQSDQFITIKENKRLYKVDVNDVYFLQAYGDYIKIITREKTFTFKSKMSTYAESLPTNFIKIHRSYIINLNSINYIEGNMVVIEENKIPISETYKADFIQAFKSF